MVMAFLFINRITAITGDTCKEPDNVEKIRVSLMRSLLADYQSTASFYSLTKQLKETRKHVHKDRSRWRHDLFSTRRRVLRYRVYGEPRCGQLRNAILMNGSGSDNVTDIDKMATCPWHMVLEVDKNRIPQSITKASCTCTKCFLPDDNYTKAGLCVEVMSYIPVIRKHCNAQKVYEYSVNIEGVPVGCTCRQNINF